MRLRTKAVWSLPARALSRLLVAAPLRRRRPSRPATSQAVVTDAQGGVLPGATVTATHTERGPATRRSPAPTAATAS